MVEVNPPLCKKGKEVGHRTRDCPQIAEDSEEDHWSQVQMDQDTGGDELRRKVALPRKPRRAARSSPTSVTLASGSKSPVTASADILGELTAEEMAILAKRRERQAASQRKVAATKALTGLEAAYPLLSHKWSSEVACNMVASMASRMMTFLWKKVTWQLRVKQAVEQEGCGGREILDGLGCCWGKKWRHSSDISGLCDRGCMPPDMWALL